MKARVCMSVIMLAAILAGCGQQPAAQQSGSAPAATVPSFPTSQPPAVATVPSFPTSAPTTPPTPTTAPSPTPVGFDTLVAAAQEEGQLNVIALPHDWMNFGEVISTFAMKYGISVREYAPEAASAEELRAIRSGRMTGDPSAPDVIDIGSEFALQAKKEKLIQPYQVATWDTIPDAAKDSDGYWYGDYYGIIVFEVNTHFSRNMPQDWPDLLNPGYQLALPGLPSESYESMMAVYSASLANGGSLTDTLPGLRLFQSINHAGNLMDTRMPSGGFANSETVLSGLTPILLRWDFLALADQLYKPGGSNIEVVPPASGNVAGFYAQAISAYAPHPNAAKLWMEFLYSDEGQMLLLKGLGHPIRFGDLVQRHVVAPADLVNMLPSELYLNAEFPTAEQISAADKSILGSWRAYVP
jgi:putative spermidine/putrescine transport system substrate-binding protein